MTATPGTYANFRPTDHSEPVVKPLPPTSLTAAERQVHRIGARLNATPAAVEDVLAALGLRDVASRARCAGCDRPMVRGRGKAVPPGCVAHNAHGRCRNCSDTP